MIEQEKRNAVYQLHLEGISIRQIARQLKISRHSVGTIIAQEGMMPQSKRSDRNDLDDQLLIELWQKCDGWIQRIHEQLSEEEGIQIGYSTLTRRIRELDLGHKKTPRSIHVEDTPGEEMQHDTSPYRIKIADRKVGVVASVLYIRYSKIRYLKFYPFFNRFSMKCFFHEALSFFGFAAGRCIIDNTNLARLRGSGKKAVIVLEMQEFSRQYGFEFICHEIGHANRKAGNERSFYTLESNFFPGREFGSFQDLNQQALQWATQRLPQRPVAKSGLIPARAFEFEQAYLIKLPPYIHPPYQIHHRGVDQYGYVAFQSNYYWIPNLPTASAKEGVKVLQYSDCIKIYQRRNLLVQYDLAPVGVKNQRFSPPGQSPKYQPVYRKKPTASEEKKLRSLSTQVDQYLSFALKQSQQGKQKHRFIRQLFALYKKLALPLFIKTLQRALRYRITDFQTIERIALLNMNPGACQLNLDLDLTTNHENLKNRQAFLEGYFSDEGDTSRYDRLVDEQDQED